MKVKFAEKEYQYILSKFLKDRKYSMSIFEDFSVELDEDIADIIRDWAGEQQQIVGFDENYNLNKEGQLLDGIIDKLNH